MPPVANGSSGGAASKSIKARALIATGPGEKLQLDDIELDASKLQPDEVVVRFHYSGICHTDVSAIQGILPVSFPCVLGHEGAGVIESVPPTFSQEHGFQVGDTVLCSFTSCDQCEQCGLAAPARCDAFFPANFAGLRPDMTPITAQRTSDKSSVHAGFFGQSSFASRSVVSVRSLVKTDTKIPLELVCAFGCGIQTGFGTTLNMLVPSLKPRSDCSDLPGIRDMNLPVRTKRGDALANNRAPPNKRHSLCVFGAGAVGIAAVCGAALAKDSIDQIIVVDLVDARLELARKAGATHVLNSRGLSPDETAKKIQELTADGQGPRLIVEATGAAIVFETANKAIRTHGVVALVGAGPVGKTAEIDVATLLIKQGRLQGVIEGAADPSIMVPYMIKQYERGYHDDRSKDTSAFAVMRDLVHVYAPEDIEQALADAASGKVVKPVIRWL